MSMVFHRRLYHGYSETHSLPAIRDAVLLEAMLPSVH